MALTVTATAPRRVRVSFDSVMSDDSALVEPENYTLTDLNGEPQTVTSVAKETSLNPSAVLLQLSADLESTRAYRLVVDSAVTTADEEAIVPNSAVFEWVALPKSFAVPIKAFSGEAQGGLFGEHGGLVFFSPALDTATPNSVLQVEEVEVCTTAYDVYRFPQLIDPQPLFTFSKGTPLSGLGAQSVLWAHWSRLSEARVDFARRAGDAFLLSEEPSALTATLHTHFDITQVSLLNSIAWKTFDNEGEPPFYFRSASNLSPLEQGHTLEMVWSEENPSQKAIHAVLNGYLNVSDEVETSYGDGIWVRTHSDTLSVSDHLDLSRDFTTEGADTATLTDAIEIEYTMLKEREIADTLTIPDSTLTGGSYSRGAFDQVTVEDQVGAGKLTIRDLSDTLSTTESSDIEANFDPATLPLTLWLRGSYAGAPWAGTASAGGSGSVSGVYDGADPSVGSAVDGFAPADFDGTNDLLEVGGGTTATIISASDWWIGAMVYIDAVDTNFSNSDAYANDAIIMGEESFGLNLRDTGSGTCTLQVQQRASSSTRVATTTVSVGSWIFVEGMHDGTNMRAGVNGGALSVGNTAGAMDIDSSTVYLGLSAAGYYFNGKMMEVMACARSLTDGERAGVYAYLKARYPSAGLP